MSYKDTANLLSGGAAQEVVIGVSDTRGDGCNSGTCEAVSVLCGGALRAADDEGKTARTNEKLALRGSLTTRETPDLFIYLLLDVNLLLISKR